MNRSRAHVFAVLAATALPLGIAQAQEGYGTLNFTVQVTGPHNIPTTEGGHRNIQKSRTFKGVVRMKYAGQSFAPPPTQGYDKASFEREKDACERKSSEDEIAACQDAVQERQNAAERASMSQGNPLLAAMKAPRTDVWVTESCTGELEVADKGSVRGITPGGGMNEVPYSMTATFPVTPDAPGSDGCSFGFIYNPATQTVDINFDPGPQRLPVVERTGDVAAKTNINPFDWSSVRKFEHANIKITGSNTKHSGAWSVTTGEPMAMGSATRVKGEVVQTATRVTWEFAGQPKSKK